VRPLELRLRGFRSYAGDDTVFSFRDRRLVGVVGPIGSGKSTILDAISFALYGRTASIGRGTRALIHQRSDSTSVALRFLIDDEVWEVQRMLRRKGSSQHALYRLDADVAEPEHLETVLQEGEVNQRITDLLGLDFAAFGRSVMLAQGRFAEFLMAPPAERDKVLKGVFGHDRIDRMRDVAKARASEHEVEAEKAAFRAQHLSEQIDAAEQRREELTEVELRAATLEEARPEIETLEVAEAGAAKRSAEARARHDELRALGGRFPDPAESSALLGGVEAAGERRVQAAGDMEAATVVADQAERELGRLEADGERARLERAGQLLATRDAHQASLAAARKSEQKGLARLEEAKNAVREHQERLAAAEEAATAAESGLATADAELAAVEKQLHVARHRDMAAALREGLSDGDLCPVCDQVVGRVPEGDGGEELAGAEDAVHQAREARKRGEQLRSEASAGAVSARASRAAAEARLAEAVSDHELAVAGTSAGVADLEGIDADLRRVLGSEDPMAVLTARRGRLNELTDTVAATRRTVAQARTAHDEAISAEQAIKTQVDDLRMRLVDASARLGGLETVEDDPNSIRRALDDLRTEWERARDAATAEADLAAEERESAAARRATLTEILGLAGPLPEELARVRATATLLGDEIAKAAAARSTLSELVRERDALVHRRDLFRRLAGDLTDARFIRFLLDEERSRLAELGSDHFQRLSGGRYRFTEDGEFGIVDLTAAEAERRADSLSGGETFLASLGLALALAEMVARTGGRLDAFFLDEGFGTLDPEHLDLAMEGIESLVAETRLVVVVSHVPELRLRVDDLIELERSPTTGNTKVLRA
jgi:exonuclease SbcC